MSTRHLIPSDYIHTTVLNISELHPFNECSSQKLFFPADRQKITFFKFSIVQNESEDCKLLNPGCGK
jgi:hypothetical protein